MNRIDGMLHYENKLSFHEMICSADKPASALSEAGKRMGNEVVVCTNNVPEWTYVMLALNKPGVKMYSFIFTYC